MCSDHLGRKCYGQRNHSGYSTGRRQLPGTRGDALWAISTRLDLPFSKLSTKTIKWCRTRLSKRCAGNCRSPKRKSIGRRSPRTRSARNLRMLKALAGGDVELTFHLGDSSFGFFFIPSFTFTLLHMFISDELPPNQQTLADWFDVLLLLLRGLSF